MKHRGHPYQGVLFAGLMIDDQNVHVIEFNIRFGDPETQVLMPTLQNDLFPLLYASATGTLHQISEEVVRENIAVHVVLTAKGYPSIGSHPVQTGQPIRISSSEELLFYAGVEKRDDTLYTAGGRVLGTTGVASTLENARKQAYDSIATISFSGMHYRTDIGKRP